MATALLYVVDAVHLLLYFNLLYFNLLYVVDAVHLLLYFNLLYFNLLYVVVVVVVVVRIFTSGSCSKRI